MFWAQPESFTALLTHDTHRRTTTMPRTHQAMLEVVLLIHPSLSRPTPLGCPLAEPYCGQNVARLIGVSGTGRPSQGTSR